MSKIYTIFIVAILFVFVGNEAFAQFSISGEFRPRTEYSHGYKTLAGVDQDPSIFTSQRSRLNLNYKGDKIVTKLVIQDIRTWGNQSQLVGNEDFATSIHEAWGEAFFTEQLSLKVGRQEVIYDDHRMFGSVGWAQQARSHDMGILKYEGDFKIHLGLAYHENNVRTNNYYLGPDAYKALQFLWFNKKLGDLNLSFLFLNNGKAFVETDAMGNITDESINYSQTIGPRAVYKMNDLTLSGNFYYQMGNDGVDNDLSAFEGAVDVSYKLNDNISAFAGYEILSGTAFDEDPTKNKSFTPFYGTNHKFNGFMDYFYVGNHGNNVGLQDIHLGAKYSQGKLFVQAKALIFSSAAAINATDGNYLGTEIDFWAGYKIADEIKLGVGYSHLLASDSMEVLKGGDSGEMQNWAYVMLTFTPKFFTYNSPVAVSE